MLSPVILTSCATTTASSVPTDRVFCSVSQPIYWSKNDTDKTIAAIKESNAAWKAICAAKAAKTSGVTFKDRWFGGEKLQVTAFR
jgi:hypothetical protein